ncbi:hypothetical protein GYB22_01665 [bacterium]|nr:hypothetical protein [bacterium]
MDLTRTADQAGLFGTVAFHALLFFLLLLFGKACNIEPSDPLDGAVAIQLGSPNQGGPDNTPPTSEETSSSQAEEESSQITSDEPDAPTVQETPSTPTTRPTQPSQTSDNTNDNPNPDPPRRPNSRDIFSGNPSGGTGDGPEPGTQGDPDGDGDNTTGVPGGQGIGKEGPGWKGGVDGFGVVSDYTPVNREQEFGTVVVEVCVDRNGNVISTKGGQRGTTNTSSYLRKLSEDAAKKFKFKRTASSSDVSSVNCGTIYFTYKPS